MDVKTLCLGVLTLGDMTGYEIKKHFEEELSHFFPASYGSIYPALGDLARRGLLSVRNVPQAKRPDKKVYRITAAGREALDSRLAATDAEHRVRSELFVLLYLAHRQDPVRLGEKLARRIERLREQLEAVTCFERGPHPEPARGMVAGLARATLAAQLDYLERHRDRFTAKLTAQTRASAREAV